MSLLTEYTLLENPSATILIENMADYTVITPDFVNVYISTSKDDISFSEKRFPKNITIADLKVNVDIVPSFATEIILPFRRNLSL